MREVATRGAHGNLPEVIMQGDKKEDRVALVARRVGPRPVGNARIGGPVLVV